MKKISLFNFLLLALAVFVLPSCGDDETTDPGPTGPTQNIIEYAESTAEFSELLAGADKAGLRPVLEDEANRYTIFGVTNQDFLDLLGTYGAASVADASAELLGAIITNHGILGTIKSDELTAGYATSLGRVAFDSTITTSMYISLDNGVQLNGGPSVIDADIELTNGVIHTLDGGLSLPGTATFISADPNLSMLLAAVTRVLTEAGFDPAFQATVADVVQGQSLYTIFAPTNDAFQMLLDSDPTWNSVADIPAASLEYRLKFHIVSAYGNVRSSALTDGQSIETQSPGNNLTVDLSDPTSPKISTLSVTAAITKVDIQAQNGVVHIIDRVLDQ